MGLAADDSAQRRNAQEETPISILHTLQLQAMDCHRSFLVVSFIFAVAACGGITKRQLPAGLACDLDVFSPLLANLPEDNGCRPSTLAFAQINPEDYVERQEEVFGALQVICGGQCLPFVVDLVDVCFPSFQVALGQACASNGRFPCWQGPTINNGTGVASDCFTSLMSGQCEEDCQSSIEDIRMTLGCCVNNAFNTTVFGQDLAMLQVANGQLWDSCGVDRINFCPLPDAFNTATMSTTDGGGRAVGQIEIATVCLSLIILLFFTF